MLRCKFNFIAMGCNVRTVQEMLDSKPDKRLYTVAPQDPVIDAVRMMDDHDIGAVLVMQDDALVGLLTERDYARKVVLQGRSSVTTKVEEIMTANVLTVSLSTPFDDCRQLIVRQGLRHLPVVEQGKVIGVLSIRELW